MTEESYKRAYKVGDVVQVSEYADFIFDTVREGFERNGFIGRVSAIHTDVNVPYLVVTPDDSASCSFYHNEIAKLVRAAVSLPDVVDSVVGFYERFGVELDAWTAQARFVEEVGEFDAIARAAARNPDGKPEVALEFADVIYTLVGSCLALGLTYEQMQTALDEVVAKNNGKTTDTHMVVVDPETGAKKVTRRRLGIIASSYGVASYYAQGRPFKHIYRPEQLRGFAGEVIIAQVPPIDDRLRATMDEAYQLASVGRIVITTYGDTRSA